MADNATVLATRRAYDGQIVKLDVDTVRLPHGIEVELEMIRHAGAAAVVPLLSDPKGDDPQVLLIHQFRYAADGRIWEIPAGVLEPGEDPVDCARRELAEETGGVASHVEHMTTIYTTPGFTDERIHLFLAWGISMGEARPEHDELIDVRPFPMSQIMKMIRDGEIVDAKSMVGLLYAAGFRLGW